MTWKGVLPALTTCFDASLKIDHGFVADHCRQLIAAGCGGLIVLGSLGEAAALEEAEKSALLATCIRALGQRAPVIAGISALTTRAAMDLARQAQDQGCAALMILPPYVYHGDWREMKAHVAAVLQATPLPAMLYNNPVAYGTDFLPEQIQELAQEYENLQAVKESSADARRVTALRALLGDRLSVLVGVDDVLVEGISVGAVGWVAGLANAMPAESVELCQAALEGNADRTWALYRWLLPLLRMDTGPKFVQLIKLIQQEAGLGNARVRPPRLELVGAELAAARATIRQALALRGEMMAERAVRA